MTTPNVELKPKAFIQHLPSCPNTETRPMNGCCVVPMISETKKTIYLTGSSFASSPVPIYETFSPSPTDAGWTAIFTNRTRLSTAASFYPCSSSQTAGAPPFTQLNHAPNPHTSSHERAHKPTYQHTHCFHFSRLGAFIAPRATHFIRPK
jgi:hypothetical protein